MTQEIVFLGLSLSSSWGNGHATTFRALIRGLAAVGQPVLFLERDVPWYAQNRDLPNPDFCEFALYGSVDDLKRRFGLRVARAKAVIVGSYVPDGIEVLDFVLSRARGLTGFYDIDTPITLASLEQGDETYIARRQIPLLELYFSFTGGPTLHRLARDFGAIRPHALYCAVDESQWRPVGMSPRWDLGYLGTYSPDRQPTLERLLLEPARRLPELRFVVGGPQYPADIEWPANVDRIEHVPPAEHADFYATQRFTLNVTRAAMIAAGWSPSVRLFEAAACNTPIISDRWDGLTELLPEGDAILIAEDTEAVVSALTALDKAECRRIAGNARAIILNGHTGTARAREMLRHIETASAQWRGPADRIFRNAQKEHQ